MPGPMIGASPAHRPVATIDTKVGPVPIAGPFGPPVAQQNAVVKSSVKRSILSPEERMESSFKIPVVATLVFVVTMFAIFYLGRQVGGYYAPVVQGNDVEFVGRS